MSRETKWIKANWEPSRDWTLDDRLEVVSALCELIQRDVYANRYSLRGRPNFTSVQSIIREPINVLEEVRESCLKLLQDARRERHMDAGN